MTRSGCLFIAAADAICWAVIYWLWAYNALPVLVAMSALGVLFGSLMRLERVVDAPRYDRAAAHQYAHMAIGSAALAAVAAFFL